MCLLFHLLKCIECSLRAGQTVVGVRSDSKRQANLSLKNLYQDFLAEENWPEKEGWENPGTLFPARKARERV